MQKTSLCLALAMAFRIIETRRELELDPLDSLGTTRCKRHFGDCKFHLGGRSYSVCQRQRTQKVPVAGLCHLPQQVSKMRRHLRC